MSSSLLRVSSLSPSPRATPLVWSSSSLIVDADAAHVGPLLHVFGPRAFSGVFVVWSGTVLASESCPSCALVFSSAARPRAWTSSSLSSLPRSSRAAAAARTGCEICFA